MKRWWFRLVFVALLAGLGFWGWQVFFPGPDKVIRKPLPAMARTATVPAKEAPLAAAWNAQKLGGYFTPDAEVSFEAPGRADYTINSREELVQVAASARQALNGFKVEFPDIHITLG